MRLNPNIKESALKVTQLYYFFVTNHYTTFVCVKRLELSLICCFVVYEKILGLQINIPLKENGPLKGVQKKKKTTLIQKEQFVLGLVPDSFDT